MSNNEDDDFFGEFEPQKIRRTRIKENLNCPILYCDDNPNLNVLVSEYFSENQLKYISAFFHSKRAWINIVYVFSSIFDENKKIIGMAQFFVNNVRSDLCEWIEPKIPIVTIGRAIYAATYDSDIQIQGFYDSVFNNTFFYSPFVNNRIYPIDSIFKICAFGQLDKKTGEQIDYWDRWETHFAKDQIERAINAGDCSLSRKRTIQFFDIDCPNKWLQDHIDSIPDNELWVAVDSETGGFNKLSDPIGDVTLSFDGWTAYHLDWEKTNPRIFSEFLQSHKLIMANCLEGDTKIETDNGLLPIKKIVNERLPVKVLSFNDLTGESSFKAITHYFRNVESVNKCKYWYSIQFRYKRNKKSWSNIRCTADHKLYLDNTGKVRADSIQPGDYLLHEGGFNNDLLQFFYGSLLGDGSLSCKKGGEKGDGCFIFSFCHAEKQYSYLEWKHDYLKRCGLNVSDITEDKTIKQRQSLASQNQKSFYFTSPFLRNLYFEKKLDIISKLDIKGLYILFLDDGSFFRNSNGICSISLACASLKKDELFVLCDIIKKYTNEDCHIKDASGFLSKDGYNKNLYLTKKASETLISLFKQVQEVNTIPYKFTGFGGKWDTSKVLSPVEVISVTHETTRESYRVSYDIEVEGNHNFLANGIKSSNCKFDLLFFAYHGCDVGIKPAWDTMIAGHLLNEMRSNSLKTHAFYYTNYGGYDLELEKFKWKYPGLRNYLQIPDSIRIPYACYDAAVTYQVWRAQAAAMQKEPDLWEYYHTYCLPMLKVFIKAEYKGFYVDWNKVNEVGKTIQDKIKEALAAVRTAFNNSGLNPNKKQELGRFIESLGWPCINKTKAGGFRVSKKEFSEWEKMGHTEVKTLMEYSKWMIIWNTFIGADSNYGEDDDSGMDESEFDIEDLDSFDGNNFFSGVEKNIIHHDATGLWQYKGVDNRIHTTFHAFMTKSHRHRSSRPNLQNLPKRNKEVSPIIRQCYIPPDIVSCPKEDAVQIWVFDRLNGLSLHGLDDFVEIGLTDRIKVAAKELYQYDFKEFGYRAEYYRKAEPGEYFITEVDGVNLQAMIAASMSHDKNLCDVFLSGGDFHNNNTFYILAKYQLFDDCSITMTDGKVITGMEWCQFSVINRNGTEIKDVYYKDIQAGDIIENTTVVGIQKVGRSISYEEFCKNAKRGKCENQRDIGKMIGLSFIFGASASNLADGTLRMAWNPKMCAEFIKDRGLEDLQKQIAQSGKRIQGDNLLYYVVASFFRSEFFKLYPELEKWIFECSKDAAVCGYRRTPWGSRRLLPQLKTRGKHADSGFYKNLCNIAVNSPVQDFETVVMSTAMIKIDSMYEDLGYLSYIVGTVHDSAVAINHRSELESCLRISLEAFNFEHSAAYGMPYNGECNIADYTKGEFWGFGHRKVKYKDVKDIEIIRKRYRKR